MSERGKSDWGKSRTKQSFKDQSDINKILVKAQRTGTLTHLAKYEGLYGDFAGFNYTEAVEQASLAQTMFNELPSEVRNEFRNDPQRFIDFVTDPANSGDLAAKLPALAKPGRQLIDAVSRVDPEPVANSSPAEPASAASSGGVAAEPASPVSSPA